MPDAATDLRTPTAAERLWLWRRQRGLTLAEASLRLWGRPMVNRLSRAERGLGDAPAPPEPLRWRPTAPAMLRLARRRSGLGCRAIAERAGISHTWVYRMERSGDARLVNFWQAEGYVFNWREGDA